MLPFSLIQLALGASFLFLWIFIGSNILSERMATVRGTDWPEDWSKEHHPRRKRHKTTLHGPHRRNRARRKSQLAASQ